MELWKDIPGYEGLYQVSNLGRVKSLDRTVVMPNGKCYFRSGRIFKNQKCSNGYLMIALCVDGKKAQRLIHILVAKAFIQNLNRLPEVNHLNGDKADNRVENLEWSSHSDNIKHSYYTLNRKLSRAQLGKSGSLHHRSKKVICITNGKEYGSVAEAGRELNLFSANISHVCLGKAHAIKGYQFKFANS